MKVKVKYAGVNRQVEVWEKECINKPCFKPHDCPIQGAGGVRSSQSRRMCLTNALRGCPD